MLRQIIYLRMLLKNQRLNTLDLNKLNLSMLREIIVYAYRYIPYYRRAWKKLGIKPEDIKEFSDLKKIPIIDKRTVIANYEDFISLEFKKIINHQNFYRRNTSGTSDLPLQVPFDNSSKDYLDVVYLRSLLNIGYNPRKTLFFYCDEDFKTEIYNRLGFMRKTPVFHKLTEDQQLELLMRINPEYIYYFPSILFSLAKKMLHENISLNPKLVITHAEILTPKMRRTIEKTFNTDVLDQYGATEFNVIGWECKRKQGYHVNTDSVLTEILEENEDVGHGELGSIVMTNLINRALPLIRYEIGDVVKKGHHEKCPCGVNLPLQIESIEGRADDMVLLNSKIITPRELIDRLADLDALKYKLIYQGQKKFKLELVPFNGVLVSQNRVKTLLRSIKGSKIEIKLTSEIEKNPPTGKRPMMKNFLSKKGNK